MHPHNREELANDYDITYVTGTDTAESIMRELGDGERHYHFVISILPRSAFEKECSLQTVSRECSIPYLRVSFDYNKYYIGPIVHPSKEGCLHCFENRMKNVHPNKKNWKATYGSVTVTDGPETVSDALETETNGAEAVIFERVPWNYPMLMTVMSIVKHTLETAVDDEDPLKKVYVGQMDTLDGQWHTFLPDPLCSCSQIPDDTRQLAHIQLRRRMKEDTRNYRLPNDALTLETLRDHFYDWRTGFFNHIYREQFSSVIPFSVAEMPLQNELAKETGIGRTTTYYDSEKVAILEGLERYAGMHPRGKKTSVRGSYKQIYETYKDVVHPKQLTIHSDEQFNENGYYYKFYSDDLEFNWVWAYSWAKRKPMLIPEQLVYYRIQAPRDRPVNRFCYETSNGCAMGATIEEAIYYGLLEVIERDAFLIAWYNELPLRRLTLDDVEDKNILLIQQRIEAMGYELHLFDMTMDTGIPAIWAMVVNPADDAPVKCYCAAGAHPNPEKAIFGALVEVVTSVPIYEQSMPQHREKAKAMYADGSLVQEMHDHVLLYSLPEAFERFNFLFVEQQTISVKSAFSSWYETTPPMDLTEELEHLMSLIINETNDIYIIDQTTPELERINIKAIKVIVEGMLTMSFGHQYRRINRHRVKKTPVKVGFRKNEMRDEDINPHPHPFP